MKHLPLRLAFIAISVFACSSEPDPAPSMTPLWTFYVGSAGSGPGRTQVGCVDGSLFYAIPGPGRVDFGRVADGGVVWAKEVPQVGESAVSRSGRIHYLADGAVQRIEPTGTAISPLTAGLAFPQLVTTHENAALVVDYPDVAVTEAPTVVRISAANAVEWTRMMVSEGRCLYADEIRASANLVVVAGSEGSLLGEDRCRRQSRENLWVAALSATDGRILWSEVSTVTPASDTVGVWDLAISAEDEIFVTGPFGLKALDASGVERWSLRSMYFVAIAMLSPEYLVTLTDNRLALINRADRRLQETFNAHISDGTSLAFDGDETLCAVGYQRNDDRTSFQPAVGALRWSPGLE